MKAVRTLTAQAGNAAFKAAAYGLLGAINGAVSGAVRASDASVRALAPSDKRIPSP